MRILFIGNANRKYDGQRHFSFDTRLHNGLIRNNHYVYFFSDRDEVREATTFGFKAAGRRKANEKLLKIVDRFRPEAIIFAHVDNIFPETFGEIKRRLPEIRIAQVSVDAIWNPNNLAKLKYRGAYVDATFVTTGGPALRGIAGPRSDCYFIPNFSDTSIDTGQAFATEHLPYDVACFMHADTGKQDEVERLMLANGLAQGIPGLCTRYGGWGGQPSVRDQSYLDDLAHSAMGLNLSKKIADNAQSTFDTRYLYSSDRIAHFMGNGCLTLTQSGFGLDKLYRDDEVVFFDALPDLIDKVRHYKNNPAARRAVAQKGWLKAHNEFNSTLVTQYIVERLFDKVLSRNYAWPTEVHVP